MRTVVTSRLLLSAILASTLLLSSPPAFAQEPVDTQETKEVVTDTDDSSDEPEAASTETAPTPPAEKAESGGDGGFQDQVNDAFGTVNEFLAAGMFYKVGGVVPLAVLWLVLGSIFFTVRMGFINIRAFKHAILVTAGRYDNPNDAGEVSHFQALTSALSATVGLGNIAGVAIAIALGGPGATFWMIVAGFLGMTSKFVECTLGQKYREVRPDGRVMGGAMFYLSRGLAKMGLGPVGSFLGFAFAVLCIGGSFGGGCAFQVNQSLNAVAESIEFLKDDGNRWIYGAVMTIAVGVVIIGGIRSIARVAEKIVPTMCGVYVLSCLAILLMNAGLIPDAISSILSGAFSNDALYGGFIGVLVTGFKRAAFSNEAGVGSAAIAHAAAKTEYPVREGIVALLGPFIDTVVICTMTALVIVITGAYDNPDPLFAAARDSNQGATLTSLAMDSQIAGFRYVLAIAVTLFAYSTMISWSYYGERCWAYIFGDGSSMVYRIIFLAFVFLGSIVSATNVLDFGDLMILGMAFPNVIGVVFLSGEVAADLKVYWQKYTNGEFVEYGKSK
ncbi:MAG: AGCS family alanine or glycine:cation symporter [Planctomycetaceae bacterium]|jgi:AGCS family alanine or glycine:cation symporter